MHWSSVNSRSVLRAIYFHDGFVSFTGESGFPGSSGSGSRPRPPFRDDRSALKLRSSADTCCLPEELDIGPQVFGDADYGFQVVGPVDPAGYSARGAACCRHACSTGSTIRQHSWAVSPRTDNVGSDSKTPARTSP